MGILYLFFIEYGVEFFNQFLTAGVTFIGGLQQPGVSSNRIPVHTVTMKIKYGHVVLSAEVALLGRLAIPVGGKVVTLAQPAD